MRGVSLGIATAAVLWFVMFSPLTAPYVPFWWTMTASAIILTTISSIYNKEWWHHLRFTPSELVLGVALAAALWGIYWVGNAVSSLLFSFARPQVDLIYGMKEGESPLLLSLLLLFIIGPAEEIFWRGFIQRRLSKHWNANKGFVVTTVIYAAVHWAALNFMLFAAALVAGAVWGLAYRLRPSSFTAIVISHALWDAAVFVWFPIG